MGKAIEIQAIKRGHDVVLRAGREWSESDLSPADVAIEFSRPEAAVDNIRRCIEAGVPVVVGTTGWYQSYSEVKDMVQLKSGAMLTATNFSIGVNVFFEINRKLAQLMNPLPAYDVSMKEIHHIHKKDAPSGTAITLAEDIISRLDRKKNWVHPEGVSNNPLNTFDLHIESFREDEVPGTHSVEYKSTEDKIVITHEAFNRDGFALGSVIAAEWIAHKKGIFTMSDVLSL